MTHYEDVAAPTILSKLNHIISFNSRIQEHIDSKTRLTTHQGPRIGKELHLHLTNKGGYALTIPHWAKIKVFSSLTKKHDIICLCNIGLKIDNELDTTSASEILVNVFNTSRGDLDISPEFYFEGDEDQLTPIYSLVTCWFGKKLCNIDKLVKERTHEDMAYAVAEELYPLIKLACDMKNMLITLDVGCESNHG